MIPTIFVFLQYLWNIAIQQAVGCYKLSANMHCLGCSLLGDKSLWNKSAGEISTPGKKGGHDRAKVGFDHKTLSEGPKRYIIYSRWACIDIDIEFHQLWGNAVALVGWFQTIGGQCMYFPVLCQNMCVKMPQIAKNCLVFSVWLWPILSGETFKSSYNCYPKVLPCLLYFQLPLQNLTTPYHGTKYHISSPIMILNIMISS